MLVLPWVLTAGPPAFATGRPVWSWLKRDLPGGRELRRLRFLRRLGRAADSPRAVSDPSLTAMKLALDRADLDPIAWLKLNAPPRARGLIDEIETDARAQKIRTAWGTDSRRRAWRSGHQIGIELAYHAACRRPVAMMLLHLLHELAHDPFFPGPARGMSMRDFGVVYDEEFIEEELRVRTLEPEFLRRVEQAGLVFDPRDHSLFSVEIWSMMAAGAPRSEMREVLVPAYGNATPKILRANYLEGYARFDAADVRGALTQTGRARGAGLREVVKHSPAFAEADSAGEYAAYVGRVLDHLDGRVSRRRRRQARRILLGVSPAAAPLEPTCPSLL